MMFALPAWLIAYLSAGISLALVSSTNLRRINSPVMTSCLECVAAVMVLVFAWPFVLLRVVLRFRAGC